MNEEARSRMRIRVPGTGGGYRGGTRPAPAVRTRGEVEAAVSDGINRFEQERVGRGPKHIRTHLLGDLLVVRLRGVLTAAEQQLVKSALPEKGRDLLKQVRTQLVETARPLLEAMVEQATGSKVVSQPAGPRVQAQPAVGRGLHRVRAADGLLQR